jgi:hypothetical protein
MIAYRAETSLASLLRERLERSYDARALLRQIFTNEADLVPDPIASTLTVQLHNLTQAAHDKAITQLCNTLNETKTIFPGKNLTLIFKIGSSQIPRDPEVLSSVLVFRIVNSAFLLNGKWERVNDV